MKVSCATYVVIAERLLGEVTDLTAMKTLTMYIRAARTEAEAAGLETDGMAESVAKLRNELLKLTGNKLDIQIDDKNFKSSFQILKELSEIWDDIGKRSGDVTQANILNLLGGKRNANVLASIIKNFKDAVAASETASDSMGSAWAENEKYLNSIEGKTKQVEAAFQTFANSVIQSDVVKTFLDIQKSILGIATELTNLSALIPTIATIATLVKTVRDALAAKKATGTIISMLVGGNGDTASAISQLATLNKAQKTIIANNLSAAVGAGALTDAVADGALEVSAYAGAMTTATGASVGFKGALESIKAAFMSNPIGIALLGITAGIAMIKKGIDSMREAGEEAIKKADEIRDAYDTAQKTYDQNIERLDALKDRFAELNERVGENGTQGKLTTDEYKEYMDIVKQIIAISPGLAQHYASVGEEIKGGYVDAMKEAIAYQKELLKYQNDKYLAGGEELFEGFAERYRKVRNGLAKINTDIYTTMDDALWEKFDYDAEKVSAAEEQISKIFQMSSGEALWDTKPLLSNLEEMIGYYENMDDLLTKLQTLTTEVIDSSGRKIQVPLFNDTDIGKIRTSIRKYAESAEEFREINKESFNYLYTYFQTDLNNLYEQIPLDRIGEFKELMEDAMVPGATLESNKRIIKRFAEAYISALADMESASKSSDLDAAWAILEEKYKKYPKILEMMRSALFDVKEAQDEASESAQEASKSYDELAESISNIEKVISFSKNVRSAESSSPIEMIKQAQEFTDILKAAGKDIEIDNLFDVNQDGSLKWNIDYIDSLTESYIRLQFEGTDFAKEYPEAIDAIVKGALAMKDAEKAAISFSEALSAMSSANNIWKNIDKEGGLSDAEQLDYIEKLQGFVDEWNKIRDENDQIDLSYFIDYDGSSVSFDKTANAVQDFQKAIRASSPAMQALEEKFPGFIDYLDSLTLSSEDAKEATLTLSDAIGGLNSAITFKQAAMNPDDDTPAKVIEDAIKMMESYNEAVKAGKISGEQLSLKDFINIDSNGLSRDVKQLDAYVDAMIEILIVDIPEEDKEEARRALKVYYDGIVKDTEDATKKIANAMDNLSSALSYLSDHVNGDSVGNDLLGALQAFEDIKEKFGDAAKDWTWADFFEFDIDTGELRNKTGVLKSALDERAREVANAITNSMVAAGQVSEADGEAVYKRIVEALTTAKGKIESAYEDLTNAISKVKTVKSFNEAVLGYQSGDTDFLSMLEASINTAEELGVKLEDVFDFATMQPSAVAVENAIESAVDELIKGKGYSEEFADQLKAAAKAARETQSRLSALETKRGNVTNVMSSHGSFVGGAELTYDNYKSLMEISEKYADTIEYINGRLTVNAQKFDEVSIAIAKETSETAKLQIQQNNLKIKELIKQYKDLSDTKKKQEIANEIRRLQDESAGFALLASEIDNATDAFARFNSANGSAKSDRYSSALEAFGIINDVLNNKNSELFGQKGNLKFRAALDLDINPNFSFEESYAQVERYFKEDDGLWNFADDLREKFADASGNINTTVADIASELKISEDAVRALLEQLNKYNDPENQIQIDGDGSAAEQAKTIQEEIAEVMEDVNKASESIDNLNKKEVSTSTEPAQEETKTLSESLTEVSDKVDKINAKSISIPMSGTQSATEKLNGSLANMLKILQQLAEIKINIPIKLTTGTTNTPEGGSSTGTTFWDRLKSWAGFSSAKGTSGKGFFGGESLVGELGREIVVDVNNGRWYTVGDNGPEIANIPKGSIIINNAETEKILKNRGKSGGSSNANGTFTWKGIAQSIADFVDKTGKTIGNIPTRPTGNGNKGSGAPSIEDELKRIKEAFENVNAEYEHYIKHQEQSYYLSERATDYDSMRIALLNQAEYYQTIYDEAMKAVEEMKQAGADDTNEELQSVEETAWGAYQSMMGIYDQVRDLLKGALNEEVDAIQSAFGNLKTAVEQYNETGHITIDTLQALLDGGLQYLQFLTNEDGQLSINTESLRELLQARKEQLAIETALSNISRIREAAEKGETETVNALIDATQDLGSSTWDLAKAQAAELLSSQLISQEQYDKLIQNIEAARQLAAMAEDDLSMGEVDAIGQIKEKYEELNEQVDHYIKHLEQAQKVAQRYSNYNDNEGSIREQIAEYQRIIENCNQAIAEMEAEGADDTTKELQEMEEAAWSARQSIWSLYDQLYSLRTDAIAARIDNIQSSISDFQKAMEEMSDTGMVTLDTFQSIVSNGMQYLQYLNIENGQLSVNQEAVEQMIRAKKEQLAVETAMSYLNQIEEALLAGEAQKVAELVSLTEDLSESTWAAVYAKLALLKTEGLSDEDAAQVESYIEKLRDLSDLVDTNIAAPVVETVEDRLASILDAFNEVKEDLEHYIAHQEQKFTEDERALDFGGMTTALQNEIGYYQQIYNKAQETIGELMANGADDTTKELQEVEEAAWSAYNSMNEAFDKINALRVDELNEELNRLKSTYNNLNGAIDEFNEHGSISLDSFEQLLSGGIQYLTFLQKEDGQYKMTEQSLKDYISARKEQLALETAMSYLANIRQALENGEVQRVNSLIDASNELSASTWDLVAAKAAELRVMGLTDDQYNLLLANLEKLKDLTRNVETDLGAWDAETTDPIEEMEEAFNNLNKEIEHYIAHQEQAYKLNERAWDFRGMEQALNNEVGYYKRIMEEAQSTIDQMKAAGADDTNESLQAVEESMWSAQNSMFDAIDKLRSLRVDALKEELDALTNSFDDLKTAADEYNKTGSMSLSTFESILENGVQYLSLLDEEGGKYVIAKDRLQEYIQTRKEQLAIETAVSYLSEIREAMENGEEERLRKLVDATNGLSSSTWAMVDAQLAALKASGMSSEQYETVVSNVEKLRTLANQVNTDLVDGGEDVTDEYEKQQDALNKILKFTEDLIRAEAKDQVDAIKKQIEEYKEIIRLKKESLQQTKEETEYQDEVADKVKEIAQLQSKADLLALDTSRTANAERQKLLQEIQNKQEELSKYQGDHAYDAQVEALDKEAEAYEESRQAEIEAIEKSVSSEEKVYQLAIARIRDQWDTLYADLINWNTEQGSVINQEITDAWNEALKAVQAYGGYVESLAGLEAAISGKNSNGNLVVADIPKYHGGGVTGKKGKLNDDEVLAILQKGELVVDKEQKRGLYTVVDFVKSLGERLGTKIGNLRNMNIAGTMMPAFAGMTAPGSAGMVETSNISFNNTFDVHIDGGVGDQAAARQFGNTIAETAANSLFDAFNRRGINIIQTLRQ